MATDDNVDVGEQHRKQRKLLTPVFSTANMRSAAPIVLSNAQQVCALILSAIERNSNMSSGEMYSSE
jgi:cytochrome P450